MSNSFTQDAAVQYFNDSINLCNNIDDEVKKIKDVEEKIKTLQKDIRNKRQLFKGKSFYILWLLLFLFLLVLSLPTFLINKTLFLLSLPLSIIVITLLKLYYEKKHFVKYEKLYQEAIKKHTNALCELLESLFLHRDAYDEVLVNIPEKTRHSVALQIMKESLEGDFSQDIPCAVQFYQDRYNKIKKITDDTVTKLLSTISESETLETNRLETFQNLDKTAEIYMNYPD